jgi:high-affinity K+ transport system ATPase subunit B
MATGAQREVDPREIFLEVLVSQVVTTFIFLTTMPSLNSASAYRFEISTK